MFSIEFSNNAKKFLKKTDKLAVDRILEKIEKLKENPVPSDAKFIGRHKEDKVFRIRIGDYRALYKLKENEKLILVSDIDKISRIFGLI